MKKIWTQCTKELAQFKRDRLTVALAFLLPLVYLLIYGFAMRLEIKAIPLAIQDLDRSPLSRTYIERLFATNQFQAVPWDNSFSNPNAIATPDYAIDRGIAKAVMVIPPDFTRRIESGKTSTFQVLVDGTDVNNARVIENTIRATTDFFLQSVGLQPTNQLVAARVRLWFNPGRKESLYLVPGAYALILWVYPSLLAALAMTREKEQGTIIQAYAASISAAELLLGKGLAYILIAIGQTLFIMLLGSLIFGLRLVGNPTPLFIATLIFLMSSVMFGLYFGVRSTTQAEATQKVLSIGYLTGLLLSGFIYPLSNIPFPLSLISHLVPVRYYIDVTRDAFLRGTGWSGVWFAPLALALLGVLFFIGSWRGLRKMQLPE
ncbi:ABC transporter [Nostoc minutum NIES-26]|uniref:ABC transporter n=1 Tax=Nostoc minutum NIES-26 TaxID=1844469 RepID=A0A367RJ45_9NOSO|nr:ABC transporter [Nostoc minutum NIES-26]